MNVPSRTEALVESALAHVRYLGGVELHELAPQRLVAITLSVAAGAPADGVKLASLHGDLGRQLRVVAVERAGGARLLPEEAERLRVGERATVRTRPQWAARVAALFGAELTPPRAVLVVGRSEVGCELARRIEAAGLGATLVAEDLEGGDPDRVRSWIDEYAIEAVAVMSDHPERAVLTGIQARSAGAKKVVIVCDRAAYRRFATGHGIDVMIEPHKAVAESIQRRLDAGGIARFAGLLE